MQRVQKLLLKTGYTPAKLSLLPSLHLLIKAKINGKKGVFILDTGASNTCVDEGLADFFSLKPEASEVLATGAGASQMPVSIAPKNKLKIGKWKAKRMPIVLMDLSHVNQAFTQLNALPVHGIIGADVLKKGKAIVLYRSKKLFLKS